MNLDLNLQEKIDRFLEGEMETEEKVSFEQEIQSNPELQELIQLNQGIASALGDQAEHQLINAIQSIRAEKQRPTVGKVISLQQRLMRWAAIVLLLITIGIGIKYFTGNTSPDALFAANYESAEMKITEMGESNEALLQQATQFYNQSNKSEAIPLLQAYLQQVPEHWEVQLYLANALLETGQFTAAQIAYERIIQSGSSYSEIAEWNLALSYLKSNPDSAKPILEKIAKQKSHSYQANAEKLLRQLK